MRMVWSACLGLIALAAGAICMTAGVGPAFAADDPPAAAPAATQTPAAAPKAEPDDKSDPAPLSGPKTDQPTSPAPGSGGERPSRGPGGAGGREGRGVTDAQVLPGSIRQAMTQMERALSKLKTQAADAAKKDENLKLVSDMQRACLGAKQITPGRRGQTPDADKIAIYRRQLIATMQQLLTLETQLMDGKTDDAKKTVDGIADLRDESHGMLGVDG